MTTTATPSMSVEERTARIDLAAAYRLVAHFGWDDLINTHISSRVPGTTDRFLINPYGLLFEEITASSLVTIDLAGNVVGESAYRVNPAGFTIHSAIHAARDDAHHIIHLHTVAGTAVAGAAAGLLPLNQTALIVYGDLAYHDYEGIAFDHAERPRLVHDLGDRAVMLLRNHGTLALGHTMAAAFSRIYHLERACAMQIATLATGQALHPVRGDVPDIVQGQVRSAGPAVTGLTWQALLRRLDRLDPSYRE